MLSKGQAVSMEKCISKQTQKKHACVCISVLCFEVEMVYHMVYQPLTCSLKKVLQH